MVNGNLAFLIGDAARHLRRRFDARARALGVSRAQWQVLLALSRIEGTNQTRLADRLEVDTITLCRMVDRLEEAGLVERRADLTDRRAWRLYLTEAAHPLLGQLRQLGEEIVEIALAGVPEDMRIILGDTLVRVRDNLSARAVGAVAAGAA